MSVDLDVLARIAVGLCVDAGIRLLPAARGWSIDGAGRVIHVDLGDLEEFGVAGCAGVIAHECGHAGVTRPWTRPPGRLGEVLLRVVHNVLEDVRCEQWIARRYPGTVPWLAASSAAFRSASLARLPPLLQLLYGAADPRSLTDDLSSRGVDPSVAMALRETQALRRAFADCLPTPRLDGWVDMNGGRHAAAGEAAVRAAGAAAEVGAEPFLAVVERFWEADIRRLAEALEADRDRVLAALGVRRWAPVLALAAAGGAPCAATLAEARALWERLLARRGQPVGPILDDPAEGGWLAKTERVARSTVVLPQRLPPGPPLSSVRALAASLAARLSAAFPPRGRRGLRRLGEEGVRAHLPAAMNLEGDPRASGRIWSRRATHQGRSAAVLLLVDVSGSMEGESIEAAGESVAMLALALGALAVDYAVFGYQDVLIPLLPFGVHSEGAVGRSLKRMGDEVLGRNAGGNNQYRYNDDGPCLDEAARILARQAATDRLLVVITDGTPGGRRSGELELVEATRRWSAPGSPVKLVGIGVGRTGGRVGNFYRTSVGPVEAAALPAALAEAVAQELLGG